MTGHFASGRGGRPPGSQIKLARRGQCLVAVIDATALRGSDATMHDQDDTGLPAQLRLVTSPYGSRMDVLGAHDRIGVSASGRC